MQKDLYVILRVTPEATPDDIRSAYRRLAMELHPDRSGVDSEPFIELQEAYSVLSDPMQRAAYDRRVQSFPVHPRRTTCPSGQRAEPLKEVEPVERFRDVSLTRSFESFSPSFDEIFDRLWSNFGSLARPKSEHLESLNMDIPVSEDQALAGGSARILVPVRHQCRTCQGQGSVGFYECWRCRSQGTVLAEVPVEVSYPEGLHNDYVVRLSLDSLGIRNLFLTVRFRPG
jgi:DnaJ-class molecular chaperone